MVVRKTKKNLRINKTLVRKKLEINLEILDRILIQSSWLEFCEESNTDSTFPGGLLGSLSLVFWTRHDTDGWAYSRLQCFGCNFLLELKSVYNE